MNEILNAYSIRSVREGKNCAYLLLNNGFIIKKANIEYYLNNAQIDDVVIVAFLDLLCLNIPSETICNMRENIYHLFAQQQIPKKKYIEISAQRQEKLASLRKNDTLFA
jgi:hypothetical protein